MTTAAEKILAEPEEFDVLDFLDDEAVGAASVEIYTGIAAATELAKLATKRQEELAKRKQNTAMGKGQALSLDEGDEDTEYDERINELVEQLEERKLIFHLQTVSPALESATRKSFVAKNKKPTDADALTEYNEKLYRTILAKAIKSVEQADGKTDTKKWTAARLSSTLDRLYFEQREKLLTSLGEMVYSGAVLEYALTADFS